MNLGKIFKLGEICGIFDAITNELESDYIVSSCEYFLYLVDSLCLNHLISKEEWENIKKDYKNYEKAEKASDERSMNNISMDIDISITSLLPIWTDRFKNALEEIKMIGLVTDSNLNPEKLASGAKAFFEEKIWNSMKKIEREDLEDACHCLAVKTWTPSGMITMRSVESALRSYYEVLTGNDAGNKLWGIILNELKRNSGANQKLLNYFDNLKDIRNTLQHPEARLNQFEGEDTFHHAIAIFNEIYN